MVFGLCGLAVGVRLLFLNNDASNLTSIIMITVSALAVVSSTISGINDAFDLFGKLRKSSANNTEAPRNDAHITTSKNQRGGVTAGHIGVLNITSSDAAGESKQEGIDKNTAILFKGELSYFLFGFKTCLHWTLPAGNEIDAEFDDIFNYGRNFSGPIDVKNISTSLIRKLFHKYDFTKPMHGYSGVPNFHPTGFNNILGILARASEQLGVILTRYGSSSSISLVAAIELMVKDIDNLRKSMRLDLSRGGKTTDQTITLIAELIVNICSTINEIDSLYLKGSQEGYPMMIGKVTKSHKTNGEIAIEAHFCDY